MKTTRPWVEEVARRLLCSYTSTTRQLHKTGTKLYKKCLSKHTHAGSTFEEHVTRIPTLKADLNSDVQFKIYDFSKILKSK